MPAQAFFVQVFFKKHLHKLSVSCYNDNKRAISTAEMISIKADKLSIEEKIKIIRTAKGVSQIRLAEALNCSDATVSRAEKGQGKYTDKQVRAAREFLGIEKVPLFDEEIASFKERLYVWRDLIKDEHMEEARKLHQDLGDITYLTFETDLIILYRILEVRMLLRERSKKERLDEAGEKLELIKPLIEEASKESQYYFYYTMGSLHFLKGNYEEALLSYTLADSIENKDFEKEAGLLYNLAICHAKFGKYVLVIGLLERMRCTLAHDRKSVLSMYIDNTLGANYGRIGHLEQARELYDKALAKARSINHKLLIGILLHNHGFTCFEMTDFKEAIRYFDEAFEYLEEGSDGYFMNLYSKLRCLIAMRSSACKEELIRASLLAQGNQHYTLLFDSLSHMRTLREKASLEYIENITVPYLLDKYEYHKALDYCKVLEITYKKLKRRMKSLEMKALAFDIYIKMTSGREW